LPAGGPKPGATRAHEASALDPASDIATLFGPLASMHAALDRIGAGMPCALAARFEHRHVAEVEHAIEAALDCFSVLQSRLVWRGSRASLAPLAALARDRHSTAEPLLSFSSGADGQVWRYRLSQSGSDVWLKAVWAHAVADGLSMLRFLRTVNACLSNTPLPIQEPAPRRVIRVQPMTGWLTGFLLDQRRRYVSIAAEPRHCVGATWFTASPGERDRLLAQARSRDGFAGWLAAAALLSVAEQQDRPRGKVLLNVPIVRDRLKHMGGFGFGVGSLILPVALDADDTGALARRISARLRAMAESGWDENLQRFLGTDPRRHIRFARIQRRRRSSPAVTVSWKGFQHLGAGDGLRDVACCAASSAMHISSHADRNGLSISVASRQSRAERVAFLELVAQRLECSPAGPFFDLDEAGSAAPS
jgi:hypothetical protein